MAKVTITITTKSTLLDAQGRTVNSALESLGYSSVSNVRIGKIIELDLDGTNICDIEATAAAMCERLLANPVLEDYKITVTL